MKYYLLVSCLDMQTYLDQAYIGNVYGNDILKNKKKKKKGNNDNNHEHFINPK